MVSITQIQYLLAVDKYRHFGKAAKACSVTQPTLSQQIQKLEDDLEVILFDRQKKPILPTEEGVLFIRQAKVVWEEHQQLVSLTRQEKGVISGKFKLAVLPTIAPDLIPLFIHPFSKLYPSVELTIVELQTHAILDALEQDDIEGGILATPLNQPHFKVHPLYYEPLHVFFSRSHPLLTKKSIEKDDLNNSEIWLLQDGHCFKNQVVRFCSDSQKTSARKIQFQGGSIETLRSIVQKGYGFTLIPALYSMRLSKEGGASQVRTFASPEPVREISFVYRRDHWKLPIVKAIETVIQECVKNIVALKMKKSQVLLEID